LLRLEDRVLERGDVLDIAGAALGPVHGAHVPAVGLVTCGGVLGEGDRGVALDGDLVVIPQHDQVAELLGAREGARLGGDALLQVAVGSDHVGEVIEGARAGGGIGIEQAALATLRHRHAHGGGDALAEGAGGDLHARGVEVLGVARGLRAPGAQLLDVLLLEAEAAQEELDVLGQARVAGREHEPVAAQPGVVLRVVAHHVLVEQVRGGSEAHRGARVTVADLLHRVSGEDARGVDRPLVELGPALGGREVLRHVRCFLSPGCGHSGRSDRHARAGAADVAQATWAPWRGATPPSLVRMAHDLRARRISCRHSDTSSRHLGLPGRCWVSPVAHPLSARRPPRLGTLVRPEGRFQEEGRWAVTATQGTSAQDVGQDGGLPQQTPRSPLRRALAGLRRLLAPVLAVVMPYVALTKPRIIELLLITTVPTMFLAAGGFPSPWLIVTTMIGGYLAAGGANTLNM